MAENYLQFSEVLANLADPEINWLRQQLKTVYVFEGREYTEDDLPSSLRPDQAEWLGCVAHRDMADYDAEFDEGAGFEHKFVVDKPDEKWGRHLWLYAEESGYVARAAHLVQKFLRTFRPQDCWSLTYATTCSKMRVGEFGGGAVFVTAAEINWLDAHEFVEAERERVLQGRSET